jgi:hypothetical protein
MIDLQIQLKSLCLCSLAWEAWMLLVAEVKWSWSAMRNLSGLVSEARTYRWWREGGKARRRSQWLREHTAHSWDTASEGEGMHPGRPQGGRDTSRVTCRIYYFTRDSTRRQVPSIGFCSYRFLAVFA